MLRIGLTGGLASGKSFVGDALIAFGCHLIHADELGHEVLLPAGEAYGAAVREFGREILDGDGIINRKKLASIVFGDATKLQKLSALVHPAVLRREEHWMDEIRQVDPNGIAVVEAAILVETGSYRRFDRLIVVYCKPEQQLERAMKRHGLSREKAVARIERQLPIEDKLRVADFAIDTSGTKESTLEQTREVFRALRRITL